jgi:putative spermidine/putrescine transport system permease protein
MVFRGVDNPVVSEILPETAKMLRAWDGNGIPGEEIYATKAGEFIAAGKTRKLGKAAPPLNHETSRSRSLVRKTGRSLNKVTEGPY